MGVKMSEKEFVRNKAIEEDKNALEKLRELARKLNNKQAKEKLILFISFDLVNSSSYKTKNYSNWFHVIVNITEKIKNSILKSINKAQLWRTIGDEAVFIVDITNEEQLKNAVQSVFEILNEKILQIKSGEILDSRFSDDEKKIFVAQNELSLKATAWLAPVVETSSSSNNNTIDIYNLMYLYNSNVEEGLPTYEFQGNDIDTGFRLAKFTRDRRLTLSIELAYILSKDQMVDSKINIITYRSLKGIWNEKIYPIIWYHDSKVAGLKLEDSFFYDEYYTDEITKEYIDNKYCKVRFNNINTSFQKLRKIAEDRNMLKKIEDLEELLKKNNKSDKLMGGNNYLEVHCVAIVVNLKENTVLMFKRAESANKHSGEWEFGFCQIQSGQTFKDNIEKDYKQKYNIKIEVYDPIKDYNFLKHGRKIPGIFYIAKLEDYSQIKLNTDEYQEYKFKDIDDFISGNKEKEKEKYVAYDEYVEVLKCVKNYFQSKESRDSQGHQGNGESQEKEDEKSGSK